MMMSSCSSSSFDLMLKPACSGCGSTTDLYGSNCKHLTLCQSCGKTMAENRGKCYECGAPLTRLIREYNVRAMAAGGGAAEKSYFIGRFASGVPSFPKKKGAENNWSLQKEGLQGRQVSDSLKEKYKNKPWLLEDETGQSQYHGHLEGAQSATYYLLIKQGKEMIAIPAGSWYNFNKVAQYKQLTLEEAEEKMKNRRKTIDGYERWMMKSAKDGAVAFGKNPDIMKDIPAAGGGKGRKKSTGDDEDNSAEKGDEDEEEESARKARLGLNKKGSDDDEDDSRGDNFDDEDDNIEKGDDWEHEEIFTDDDEAVGNDPEEREDLGPEVPAPPEIKEDDDDEEEEGNEEEGGLSKSGKELKKLLGRANGLNDSDKDEEDDGLGKRKKDEDDDDDEDEDRPSPVLAPKLKDAKEEPSDGSPAKPVSGGQSRGTPTSKSAKGKRKNGDDTKSASAAPSKKIKSESDVKPTVKEEASKTGGASKGTSSSSRASTSAGLGPVSEEEIRAVLLQRERITTSELVGTFKARLKSPEDKKAFAEILKRISKIQKSNDLSYVVLRR